MKEKKVTLLFTTYHNFISYLLLYLFGHNYSHVSMSLESDGEYFYSFNKKGFRKEYPKRHKKRRKNKSFSIQFKISKEEYDILKHKIEECEKRKNLKYSSLGVLLCLFHIRHHFEDSYFCSRFVAEALQDMGRFELKKDPSLYLPDQIIDEMIAHNCLENVTRNPL
ncbi:hypothetical protein [Floccifex sp.]|uniref:hypothetical protein n=1 Tax=Floccifex sp. TaxID=2815810 RepID=UPI003F0AEDA3